MQALTSRRVGLPLFVAVVGFLLMACSAIKDLTGGSDPGPTNRWQNQTVYSRVGMRVEPTKDGMGWHMYSTNHVGLQRHIPVGTKFTARNVGKSKIDLVAEDNSVLHVEFVGRHHADLNFDSWLDRQLSTTPVDLPSDLSSAERTAIQDGRYEVGMSRAALFLSIGYPPTTRSPNINDMVLMYEVKRFNNIAFTFDAQGRIANIRN